MASSGTGTVVNDNLTGLVWARDANTPTAVGCTGGVMNWQSALAYVACLNTNTYLTHNDWRMPNVRELLSLIDYGYYNLALSDATGTNQWNAARGPFKNVMANATAGSFSYWTSTYMNGVNNAVYVSFYTGASAHNGKASLGCYVWPVRGGSQ